MISLYFQYLTPREIEIKQARA